MTILTVAFSPDPLFFGRGVHIWFHEIDTRRDWAISPHAPESVEAGGRLWLVCVDRVKKPGQPGLAGRLVHRARANDYSLKLPFRTDDFPLLTQPIAPGSPVDP